MAEDHYVSQTYLKHFGDPSKGGMLHAYRKGDHAYFPCWPKDVCKEWDDDLNPAIPDRPELLGELRNMFEPAWTSVVASLQERHMPQDMKLVVSLCFAHMMICVLSWRRVAKEYWEHSREATLRFKTILLEERGKKDELLAEGLSMIKKGKLRIEAEPNSVKAWLTIRLVKFACLAYHADWNFVENETDVPFLTSDNPVAVRYSALPGAPVEKFMPITPKLGLMMTFDPKKEHEGILHKPNEEIEQLLSEAPTGKIQSIHPYPATVRVLNKLIVQCAESLVFSSRKDDGVATLVAKYGRYRIEQDFVEWRERDGSFIHGVIMKVRESAS